VPSVSKEIGDVIERADPKGDHVFAVVPAAVLLVGKVRIEFVGNAKFALYVLVKTEARTGSLPDLIPFTFVQFPVRPMLSALPATPFIDVELVPDIDS
jgi:hypothetical protein